MNDVRIEDTTTKNVRKKIYDHITDTKLRIKFGLFVSHLSAFLSFIPQFAGNADRTKQDRDDDIKYEHWTQAIESKTT